MARPRLEVADIIRAHGSAFVEAMGDGLSSAKKRVLHHLETCRTASLGGHVEHCDQCGHERIAYNPCRDRHCPKCQAQARADWLDARHADILPVEYFHVVFTVPEEVARIARQNKKVVYGLLFAASAETLQAIAADPRHLGARIGFLSVLHTWGQTLHHHPHIHSVVPGGGLSPDGTRWIACTPGFFLPVKVLSRVFRGKFLERLKQAHADGTLSFQGSLAPLHDEAAFAAHLRPLYEKDWVVYAKPPFGGPSQVLKYLARYTHRVAISNHRLLAMEDGRVTFSYKDYAHGERQRTLTLDAVEFLRRFLLHVLPKGFTRIRHYGLLANRNRADDLARCRYLLGQVTTPEWHAEVREENDEGDERLCPKCKMGHMVRWKRLSSSEAVSRQLEELRKIDSS
jgi:putative transposase/transposase-like zinc-binding protein